MSQRKIKAPRPLGPTGKFPQGKVHSSDQGELQLGIAADKAHGVVVLDFGSPVAWLAMPPEKARQMAALIIEHAEELEAGPLPALPS